MQHRLISVAAVIMLACILAFSVSSLSEQKIIDNAEILSESEREKLEKQADELSNLLLLDIVIITGKDFEGRTTFEYAESFARRESFGYDENGDGVMLVADYERGKVCIYPSGICEFIFSDEAIKSIVTEIAESSTPAEYFESYLSIIKNTVGTALESAGAAQKNIIDSGKVLSPQQTNALEVSAKKTEDKYGSNIFAVTIADTGSKSPEEYADDFLKSHGGSNDVLFLFITRDRQLVIATEGNADGAFTEYGTRSLLSKVNEDLNAADYYGALTQCIDTAGQYLELADSGTPFDKSVDEHEKKADNGNRTLLLFILIAVFFVAVFVVLLVIKKSHDYDNWEEDEQDDEGNFNGIEYEDIYSVSEDFVPDEDEAVNKDEKECKPVK